MPIGTQNKDGDETLDATCNYWGHATGPDTDWNRPGKGAEIVGPVDATPWNRRRIGRGRQPRRSCMGGRHA